MGRKGGELGVGWRSWRTEERREGGWGPHHRKQGRVEARARRLCRKAVSTAPIVIRMFLPASCFKHRRPMGDVPPMGLTPDGLLGQGESLVIISQTMGTLLTHCTGCMPSGGVWRWRMGTVHQLQPAQWRMPTSHPLAVHLIKVCSPHRGHHLRRRNTRCPPSPTPRERVRQKKRDRKRKGEKSGKT